MLNKAAPSAVAEAKGVLLANASVLGLLEQDPNAWFTDGAEEALGAEAIEGLIAERALAKAEKNFARADEVRDQLTAAGVVLEDSVTGTTWRRV